jgi:AraC-like DNA-binding protein
VSAPPNTTPSYIEVAPPPELRHYVQRLWVHPIESPPRSDGRRLLPDGRIDLVWIAGLGVQISGPRTRYEWHQHPPDVPRMLVLGASFHPGAAPQLLRTPAAALVDDRVSLDAVDPRLAARLDDRLGSAPDARHALATFAEELSRHLRVATTPDPAVRHAVHLLESPSASVADAAARAFVSERELQRRFKEHIGYGPKTLQRVLRFQRFMKQIAVAPVDLAWAAAAAGYSDQSHLSRETRRLAGLTPRQLRHWRH